MLKVVNISLRSDYGKEFAKLVVSRFALLSPNFSKILVLVPSKKSASILKSEFAKLNVIAPKIVYLGEVDEAFLILQNIDIKPLISLKVASDLKIKFILFDIAKVYLQGFSVSAIFNFIEDFLELENLMLSNETDLAATLSKAESIIENMAKKLQASLVTFLKVHQDWQKYKAKHKLVTRFEKNILCLQALKECKFQGFQAICTAFFEGTSKTQISLLSSVYKLPNSILVLWGLEEKGEVPQNIVKALKINPEEISFLKEETMGEVKYYFKNFDNLIFKMQHVTLQVKHILLQNPYKKIGIIASNQNTAFLLTNSFAGHGILVSNTFTPSILESPHFILFKAFCKSFILEESDVFQYLTIIKSPLAVFEKSKAEEYENKLRMQNPKAEKPFKIDAPKEFRDLKDFITKSIVCFSEILIKKDEDFESFITEVALEGEGCVFEDYAEYLAILIDLAGKKRFASAESESVFLLSKAEARGMRFDYTFVLDCTSGELSSDISKNKILNSYLQEILEIDGKKRPFDLFFFKSALYSAGEVYVFFSSSDFEEGGKKEVCTFFLSESLKKNFIPFCIEFAEIAERSSPKPCSPLVKEGMIAYLTPSSLKNLINNPFAFYIKNVLKIKNLEPIVMELKPHHIGSVIHKAIELWYLKGIEIYTFLKNELLAKGFLYEFYCFEDCFLEVSNFFKNLPIPQKNCKVMMEEFIEVDFMGKVRLKAKPDRIEIYKDYANIIDYKVYNTEINLKDLETGAEPQLPMEELMLSLLYPDLKGKINLFYYYIDLNQKKYSVSISKLEPLEFERQEKSLQILLTELKTFKPLEFESFDECKYLIRNYG